MGTRKFKLTEETTTIVRNGAEITLHRIQAVRDFWCIKAGERGGYVESEANLSQEGDCWIYGNAKVCGNAWIYGNAKVCGNALVYDNAEVFGNAWVFGSAVVYRMDKICGDSVRCV